MAVPGKFGVGATGAATYTIPIAVPPGTAGMLPSLALAYSSQSGNGLLGMGWMLDGLPSIGRCPRTLPQDGLRGAVKYDANDRFCLDGQRLLAISGTYGANGTEYRTEVESFSKIVSFGTAGTGPAWFEVKTKSGQIMQFGNTTDSRILAQGKTTARDWALNKVSDTKGNYFTVTYTNDTTNGQAYPTRIDYTGNASAGLAAYNSVRFVYDSSRPDVVPAYHAGSLRKITVRLTNVQTYAGAAMVADYRLAYAQGSATNRSQLTSVTLCDGTGAACLPATTFGWQSGSMAATTITNVANQNGQLSGSRSYVGDFNGDGLMDILWDAQNETPGTSTGTRVLWTATGGGSFTVTSNVAGQDGQMTGYAPVVADFTRDGRTDVWWYNKNSGLGESLTRWTSTSSGTFTVVPGAPGEMDYPGLGGVGSPTLTDVDADGRPELAWLGFNTLTVWTYTEWGTINPVDFTGCASWPGWSGCNIQVAPGDFNGDGFTDLLWISTPGIPGNKLWSFWLSNPGGSGQMVTSSDSTLNTYAPLFVDINGDGKTDVLWYSYDSNGRSSGNRILWLSKGDGTFVSTANVSGQNGTLVGYRPHFVDFNGDGLVDILWLNESAGGTFGAGGNRGDTALAGKAGNSGVSGGAYSLWIGKGDGTFTIYNGQDNAIAGYTPVLGDFNGDGKTDILWDSRTGTSTRSTGTRFLWLIDGAATDVITSITTGIGASLAVTYKPLTDSTVYTKEATALDPVLDLQGAMFVVSRVDAGNGIGGTVSSTYAYVGAKVDQDGRGFLGFRKMTVTDLQTNIVQTTTYRQDFPFTSLVADETRKLGSTTLGATSNVYGATPLGGSRYQVFLNQSQATGADLDGSVLPTATSAYQYDAYSNATQIQVAATDGFLKTTTNTYTNDAANWFLGRLTTASVASQITSPGPPPGQAQTEVVIASSGKNLKLWDYLLANNLATAGVPGSWKVTISSGVTISSTSNTLPAFDTGVFPVGSTLQLINNGSILGAGGTGGSGPSSYWVVDYGYEGGGYSVPLPAVPATPGGAALRAQHALTVTNNNKIWGGGGGGGDSGYYGGGGGAGVVAGQGGPYAGLAGLPGTATTGGIGYYGGYDEWGTYLGSGGAGGVPGQPGVAGVGAGFTAGQPGGPAGPATIGNSFIIWATVGDRRGPLN